RWSLGLQRHPTHDGRGGTDRSRGRGATHSRRDSLLNGQTEFINAGHPWPLRMRVGKVQQIVPKVDLPFGFQPPHPYRVQSLDLQPGDRLVMLTDGMLERNANTPHCLYRAGQIGRPLRNRPSALARKPATSLLLISAPCGPYQSAARLAGTSLIFWVPAEAARLFARHAQARLLLAARRLIAGPVRTLRRHVGARCRLPGA
ncbi:SpoIIE family protein phosphatase, partial [Streptomyces sp. NPDC002491]